MEALISREQQEQQEQQEPRPEQVPAGDAGTASGEEEAGPAQELLLTQAPPPCRTGRPLRAAARSCGATEPVGRLVPPQVGPDLSRLSVCIA